MSAGIGESKVQSIVSRVREVAVMPQVVFQVIELTSSNGASAKDLEKAISIDPGLSTRVLTLANSAYYALPRKVTSIKEAVVFLGFKTIRQLAMTAGCFELFVGKTDRNSLRRRTWWRHAVDTAVCARMISACAPDCIPEEAYAAGLLHDIGKCLLDRYGKADYGQVDELVTQGADGREAELGVYGCDHTLLGASLAQHWRLPTPLSDAIGGHHQITDETGSKRLVAVIATANSLAHTLTAPKTLRSIELEPLAGLPGWAVSELGMPADGVSQAVEACRTAIDTTSVLSTAF